MSAPEARADITGILGSGTWTAVLMGALLPTLQAGHLREGLTDYLATTFALTDPDAQAALTDFVGDPDTGMFKGPYVRLRPNWCRREGPPNRSITLPRWHG